MSFIHMATIGLDSEKDTDTFNKNTKYKKKPILYKVTISDYICLTFYIWIKKLHVFVHVCIHKCMHVYDKNHTYKYKIIQ